MESVWPEDGPEGVAKTVVTVHPEQRLEQAHCRHCRHGHQDPGTRQSHGLSEERGKKTNNLMRCYSVRATVRRLSVSQSVGKTISQSASTSAGLSASPSICQYVN